MTEPASGMRFEEICRLLPQKFPLLMLDRVLSIEKGRRLTALKNVTGNEIFFPGHFPGMAVMPGALIIESMAQASIVLFRASFEVAGAVEDRVFVFGAAKARFFRPVVPGDQLHVEVTIVKAVSTGGIVEAAASVDGRAVAKASLTFGVKKREEFHD